MHPKLPLLRLATPAWLRRADRLGSLAVAPAMPTFLALRGEKVVALSFAQILPWMTISWIKT
ncbi:MAG: hypothetical protein AAGJ93_10000 [Bacteroidota bacterium]